MDKPKLEPVTTLYSRNARQIAEMLRMSADSIASEDDANDIDPTIAMIAVQVSQNGDIAVYGWGETNNFHAIAALHLGLTEVARIQLGVPVNRDD